MRVCWYALVLTAESAEGLRDPHGVLQASLNEGSVGFKDVCKLPGGHVG